MKRIFIIHLLLSLGFFVSGQEWAWAKKANVTAASQRAIKLEVDSLGNVYMLGVNQANAVYGKFKLHEGTFLLKYSTNGQLQWAQNLLFPAGVNRFECLSRMQLQRKHFYRHKQLH